MSCTEPKQASQTIGAEPSHVSDVPVAPEQAIADPRVARGRELYGRICAVCHGADGEGYKADAALALTSNGGSGASTSDLRRGGGLRVAQLVLAEGLDGHAATARIRG